MTREATEKVTKFFENYPARTYRKGEIIIQGGENPDGIYYLVDGLVSVYDISTVGALVVVGIYQPGSFFPMSWAVSGVPNHYFFEAKTNVTVRQAPVAEAMEFIRSHPEVVYELLRLLYLAAEAVLRRMAHLMAGDARSRLRFELINDGYRFGEAQADGTIFVPMKEGDLAAQSGLARETVNRHLRTLKKAGIIEVTHQGFIIRDFARLEAELGRDL